jgi:hypothetical protein
MRNQAFIFLLALAMLFPLISEGTSDESKSENSIHQTCLKGKVIDKSSKEELVCATVALKGTDIKINTDIEGSFILKGVEPGTYTLEISYISYKTITLENTSIEPNKPDALVIQLEQQD